jgi:tetratricopeptide (TPR) repeat protein
VLKRAKARAPIKSGHNGQSGALDIEAAAFQASKVVMNLMSRFNLLIVCVCFALAARAFGAETNSVTNASSAALPDDVVSQKLLNGYLQLQEQLHAAQLAIADGRAEATAAAKSNVDLLTARIQTLEQTIADQRAREAELAQQHQHSLLLLAGAFGLTVLAAVLFMAYLQWRAVARLLESPALQAQNFALTNGHAAPALVTGAAAQANARLFSAVDLLQKRILELEDSSRAALPEKISGAAKNGAADFKSRDESVAALIAEGQALLQAGQTEKALACYEQALKAREKKPVA